MFHGIGRSEILKLVFFFYICFSYFYQSYILISITLFTFWYRFKYLVNTGLIPERKGMRAIFQKQGKKRAKYLKI